MHFTKLRLTGFKSFVERTELDIAPGLTGVVGPNGCGKSNLVEAVRWTMGEASAKQMRGGEMDDVIFGGTAHRPPRDFAEVTLHLDNATREAPAEFNDASELEISRRIERDQGSQYRINGREVRAKDVQILFADLATGPRSTALVSQGRVAALINAKPAGRRMLLEEAAGITGLHSRRHEAELKLRAAETNLERLDDVVVALEAQLDGLKKQARQAKRYRSLSDRLRENEAVLLHRRWQQETEAVEAAAAKYKIADDAVTEKTRAAAAAATQRQASAEALPALRDTEAAAAAELHRLTLAGQELDAERQRTDDAMLLCDSRLAQIDADHTRETTLEQDAAAALDGLDAAISEIKAMAEDEAAALAHARKTMETANAAAESADAVLAELTEAVAAAEASRGGLIRQLEEIGARINELTAQKDTATEALAGLTADAVGDDDIAAAERALLDTRSQLAAANATVADLETRRGDAETAAQQARDARAEAAEQRGRTAAEAAALRDLVASAERDAGNGGAPMIDRVVVTPGYENALGAALGADLDAPVADGDGTAKRWWRSGSPPAAAPRWPAGVTPLFNAVDGPPELATALAHVGVVADRRGGDALASHLAPGQSLVSRAGDYWRWDGYTVSADAVSREAVVLRQKNRLTELEADLAVAERSTDLADQAWQAATASLNAIREDERAAREQAKQAAATHAAAAERHADVMRAKAEQASRLESLRSAIARIEDDVAVYAARRDDRHAELDALENLDARRAELEAARVKSAAARSAQHDARAAYDALEHESRSRKQRREAMEQEQQSWTERRRRAAARIAELAERRRAVEAERAELATKPAEIDTRRAALLELLATAEQKRTAAADALQVAETKARNDDAAAREADAALAQVREDRVRAESQAAQADQARQAVADRIAERLECAPDQVLDVVGLGDKPNLPDLETAERRFERLIRERDNMGPVNLRAEQEVEELSQQIDTMHTERDDLIAAIGRLRQGIAGLNREARQRLLASFDGVNKHFQELFTELFGGGKAYLELIEADDPLEAGLEIFASPPGKKLQTLSLLSGGEQALTAVALMFGVFLTNPAPICVLDEVDAPLDDANVDRFCNLLDKIVRQTQTRFVLVTHHRMTMARMDRLYGVTMTERGVSQLVSVDLQQAEELRQTA